MNNSIIGRRKSISSWLRQFVTVIDFANRTYKIQEGLFGIFKWGQFKKLPDINYVLVFTTFYAKCEACAMDEGFDNPNSWYQVSLVHHKNRRIIVHETKNSNDAFEMAKKLAVELKARIRDSATDRMRPVFLDIPVAASR
jgi:hypothetical protein